MAERRNKYDKNTHSVFRGIKQTCSALDISSRRSNRFSSCVYNIEWHDFRVEGHLMVLLDVGSVSSSCR